jgi:hypothetical protein
MKDACKGEPQTVAPIPSLAGASECANRGTSLRRGNMPDNEWAVHNSPIPTGLVNRTALFPELVRTKDSRGQCGVPSRPPHRAE